MPPSAFGIVMATGIISIAADLLDLPLIAGSLFHLNVALYAALWLLTVLRIGRFPRRMLGELVDHRVGMAFFTMVAGSAIVGSQFVVIGADVRAGVALWFVAVVLWVVLTYTLFTAFTIKEVKPSLEQAISGVWLLAVVATQSLAVLAALLAPRLGRAYQLELNFFALSMWLWGGMLYIWLMLLIFYRYAFFRLAPADLSPSYWINMGATAISTLAGSLLAAQAADAPLLHGLLPFIKGFTLFYWSAGTWWIPMLVALGVWRYVYKRFPLRYSAQYWSVVFPLGMYAAGTHAMSSVLGLDFLDSVPWIFFACAVAAWLAASAGLIASLASAVRRRNQT